MREDHEAGDAPLRAHWRGFWFLRLVCTRKKKKKISQGQLTVVLRLQPGLEVDTDGDVEEIVPKNGHPPGPSDHDDKSSCTALNNYLK